MLTSFVIIAIGLVGLILGSDVAVRCATRIAERLGVSPLIIGLTLTSIGTSLPEIATNLSAALNATDATDTSGLAVGNIVGSNVSQITLLLGISALVAPIAVPRVALRRDGVALLLAMGAMGLTGWSGETSQVEGLVLVLAYGLYLWTVWYTREPEDTPATRGRTTRSLLWDVGKTLAGLGVVVLSADLIIDHGVTVARDLGVSETVIGLGLGLTTSLPELAVAVRGAQVGAGDLVLGNLLGSNVTDPLLSFGLGAAVYPVTVERQALVFDGSFWLLGTILALVFMARGMQLRRGEGAILAVFFVGYVVARYLFLPAG